MNVSSLVTMDYISQDMLLFFAETVPFTPVTDDNPYNVREQAEPDEDPYSCKY